MADSFENLDYTLPDWLRENVGKSLVEALNKYTSEEGRKTRFFLENDSAKLSQGIRNHCFSLNLTNTISKMFMRLIYLKNLTFSV